MTVFFFVCPVGQILGNATSTVLTTIFCSPFLCSKDCKLLKSYREVSRYLFTIFLSQCRYTLSECASTICIETSSCGNIEFIPCWSKHSSVSASSAVWPGNFSPKWTQICVALLFYFISELTFLRREENVVVDRPTRDMSSSRERVVVNQQMMSNAQAISEGHWESGALLNPALLAEAIFRSPYSQSLWLST